MARDSLTGTRIRERREVSGLKQADLARKIGISPSYLNLIEHNRRRIGGKLLLDIASALEVEAQALTEGTAAALIASLRESAHVAKLAEDEVARVEEFAGRFPGWSKVLVETHKRVVDLERMVETMSDRMAHDPHLAASLHEVLTTTASIRSTAAILAETPDLEGPLRYRFHANMHEDSQRLSDSARTLVRFLDADPANTAATGTAQDEVDAWLARHEFTFPELESSDSAMEMLLDEDELSSETARHIAKGVLLRYVSDAKQLRLSELRAALTGQSIDPVALGQHFQVEIPVIFRRLSALPEAGLGLAVCDRAGSLIFRKPVEEFALPKLAAACALWPIYDVFSQPSAIGRAYVKQQDRSFEVFVAGEEQAHIGYNRPSLYHALMLICPAAEHEDVLEVGSACRICARAACIGRREPTILAVNAP